MTHERATFTFRALVLAVTLGAVAGIVAMYGACTGADDSQPDTTGCTLESCMSLCLAAGEPGGECVATAEAGVMCVCREPQPDADADGDGEVADDGAPDREDVREDAPVDVVEDGETVEGEGGSEDGDGDIEWVREDAPREDAGPRCSELSTAWTFNLGASGWTHAAIDPPASGSFDPWVVGIPTAGPGSCRGGGATNQCWTTGLAGSYPTCQIAALTSPTLALAPCATSSFHVDIVFWQWHEFAQAAGSNDGGFVEVSADGGATWTQIAPVPAWDGSIDMSLTGCEGTNYANGKQGFLGTDGRWVQETIRVTPEYLTDLFSFRFVFGSDGATSGAGWFIDDVAVRVL
jgi:hypothetical protein